MTIAHLAEHVEDARIFAELGAHFFVAVIDFEDAPRLRPRIILAP